MSATPWVLRLPSYVADTDAALSRPREAHHNPEFRASTFCSGGHAGRGPKVGDRGCPALWVGHRTGESLEGAAETGQAIVTLNFTAKMTPGRATETVWGLPPGSGPDLGMLALAQYFAQRERRRDLYFVVMAGAFPASAVHYENLQP